MKLESFSLLYPDESTLAAHLAGRDTPDIDMYTLQELGLLEHVHPKSLPAAEYATTDPAVIAYRNRTFADLLIAQETERTEKSGELPLICEDTFVNMGDSHASRYQLKELFTPEQLRSRIALQNYITGSTRLKATVFSMIDGVRTSGFLVQSCVACQNGRDNDYTQQFNVVDPLLWILDQFGIFPSYIEEGE